MAGINRTMAYGVVDTFSICIHGADNPGDDEWNAYVATLANAQPVIRDCFVYTHGGGPNVRQRDDLASVLKRIGDPRVVVVTHAMSAKNIVAALNFSVDQRMRVFPLNKANDALASLTLQPALRHAASPRIRELAEDLGIHIPIG